MIRWFALPAAVLMLTATVVRAQNTGKPKVAMKEPKKEARLRYQSAQAALHSALSHAQALEAVADEPGDLEADLALSHAKTVNRDANECNTDTVKMTQAVHSLEKNDDLKSLHSELTAALKAVGKAHDAIDGHGELKSAAKDTTAHLRKALAVLNKLADAVGAKPLPGSGDAKKAEDD
jgi:hypothetical protein